MKTEQLEEAAVAIVETRDLCGDENAALRQFQSDYGKLTADEIRAVRAMTETIWAKNQQTAGVVHPLTSEERARAFQDIESGK